MVLDMYEYMKLTIHVNDIFYIVIRSPTGGKTDPKGGSFLFALS